MRIGDIISVILPPMISTVNVFAEDPAVNPMSGKWLVTKIEHLMDSSNYYYISVSCVRDSSPLGNPSESGENGE